MPLQVAQEIESEAKFQNDFINQLVCHTPFILSSILLLFYYHRWKFIKVFRIERPNLDRRVLLLWLLDITGSSNFRVHLIGLYGIEFPRVVLHEKYSWETKT